MKQTKFSLLVFITAKIIFAQSTMVYEPGTTIEVTTGADICADNVTDSRNLHRNWYFVQRTITC